MSSQDKSPDAFRTISEVAEDLDLPQHVLRFWETRFSQIKPLKRGGGRRYYRPEDVELLKGIRHLLYGEGYTIKGVQRILKEHGPRFAMQIWQEPVPAAQSVHAEDEPGGSQDVSEVPLQPSTAGQPGKRSPGCRTASQRCTCRRCAGRTGSVRVRWIENPQPTKGRKAVHRHRGCRVLGLQG